MKGYNIIKIGGNVVDDPKALDKFVLDFANLPGQKILVHGGGKEATRLSSALGISTKMIDGRRVTDASTLEVVTMVYAGLVNKRIVSKLQEAGCKAIGLCGADGNVITAHKRASQPIDYGYVGDIDTVDTGFLKMLIGNGITPVVCAITSDGHGQLLNSNADGVASSIAVAMSQEDPTDLTYCFEKIGVLTDINDPDSLIRSIDSISYKELKNNGVINSGMIPKIENALKALEKGVVSVIIKSSENLLQEISTTIKL